MTFATQNPMTARSASPPSAAPRRPTQQSPAPRTGLAGWAVGLQEDRRLRNQQRRVGNLTKELDRPADARQILQPEALVNNIDFSAKMKTAVFDTLPEGLKNRDTEDKLEYMLSKDGMRKSVELRGGEEERVKIAGNSSYWNYSGHIALSLHPERAPQLVSITQGSMDRTYQGTEGRTRLLRKTTGRTYTAGLTGGKLAGIEPGAVGSAGFSATQEKAVEASNALGHLNSGTIHTEGDFHHYEVSLSVRFRVAYTKEQRWWAKWARGERAKEITLGTTGYAVNEQSQDAGERYREVFGSVTVRCAVSAALDAWAARPVPAPRRRLPSAAPP
ncbi:hypothetical protein [Streptomyces sp. NPDC058579]|uniref:hypothetical protein n=1 Tax=Streptomyces sp. NPDC058579 TaxID=3346548 RepID=UPI0036582E6C